MTVYVWHPERGVIPKQEAPPSSGAFHFMPDIAEFRSPLDGSLVSSRSTLRAHEQRHGVRQCGELKSYQDFDPRRTKPFTPVIRDC